MAGRREMTKARTRAAIIDAGIRLMHEGGYDATSTTAIARAAGVSPATLFNYFPTKSSIVFADDELWAPTVGSVPAQDTPRQTLVSLMLALLDQPRWTRPADAQLTALRFELVRREPVLASAQVARAFSTVPAFAQAVRSAHTELTESEALAHAGAVVGTVLAVLTWSPGTDIRATVMASLEAV